MNSSNNKKALEYDAQARYFLEAAKLVSDHCNINKIKNPQAYHNFETVIVGTHHAFSAELLIKGIIYFHKGNHPKKHKIIELFNDSSCANLKAKIKNAFNPKIHISYPKQEFEFAINNYLENLNKNDNDDKEEINKIKEILTKYEFDSFESYLELHSNHFVKMRYSCEKFPPPLDMNFTSFLNNQLRDELENNLLKI